MLKRMGLRSKIAVGVLAVGVIAVSAMALGNATVQSPLVGGEPPTTEPTRNRDHSMAPSRTEVPAETAAQSASPVQLNSPPAGMVLYANQADGYALWLWGTADSAAPVMHHGALVPGTARFGEAEFGVHAEFTITVGTRDGRIRPCASGYCNEITVTSLDELGAALATNPYYVSIVREVQNETRLGGEPSPNQGSALRRPQLGPTALHLRLCVS